MRQVGYTYDPMPDYIAAIDSAQSVDDLCTKLETWRWIADDAYRAAADIKDWRSFKDGLAKERKRKFAGEEWQKNYADIIMPLVMLLVSQVADQFKVPWGLAYNRLVEAGRIGFDKGIAVWNVPPEKPAL